MNGFLIGRIHPVLHDQAVISRVEDMFSIPRSIHRQAVGCVGNDDADGTVRLSGRDQAGM